MSSRWRCRCDSCSVSVSFLQPSCCAIALQRVSRDSSDGNPPTAGLPPQAIESQCPSTIATVHSICHLVPDYYHPDCRALNSKQQLRCQSECSWERVGRCPRRLGGILSMSLVSPRYRCSGMSILIGVFSSKIPLTPPRNGQNA